MASQSGAANAAATALTWQADPNGVSILLATGRRRHDLLVVSEPALLTELEAAWGRPHNRVRLSLLPGVCPPQVPGQEDALFSYDRQGLGVLVARGRTFAFEGRPRHCLTALAAMAAGAGVRAALLVMRASSMGGSLPGNFLCVADHLNCTGAPLFAATQLCTAGWDASLNARLANLADVKAGATVALVPGPLRATPAEAAVFASLGVQALVNDGVAEAMLLASRGVKVAGLAYVDHVAAAPQTGSHSGRRVAALAPVSPEAPSQPAPVTVYRAIEAILETLR